MHCNCNWLPITELHIPNCTQLCPSISFEKFIITTYSSWKLFNFCNCIWLPITELHVIVANSVPWFLLKSSLLRRKVANFLIFALFYEPLDIVLTWTQWTLWNELFKKSFVCKAKLLLLKIQEIIKRPQCFYLRPQLLNYLHYFSENLRTFFVIYIC